MRELIKQRRCRCRLIAWGIPVGIHGSREDEVGILRAKETPEFIGAFFGRRLVLTTGHGLPTRRRCLDARKAFGVTVLLLSLSAIANVGRAVAAPFGAFDPSGVDGASQAQFSTPPGEVRASAETRLDGSASRAPGASIQSFVWKLSGGAVARGSTTVDCTGGTSELNTVFLRAGTATVSLQVTDASGSVTSVTHTLSVAPPLKPRFRLSLKGEHVKSPTKTFAAEHLAFAPANVSECVGAPSDPVLRLTKYGGFGGLHVFCPQQLEFDLIDAWGCLSQVQFLGGANQIVPEDGAILVWDLERNLQAAGSLTSYLQSQGLLPAGQAQAAAAGGTVTLPKTTTVPPSQAQTVVQQLERDQETAPWYTTSTVLVNGLEITPENGHEVVFYPEFDLMASADADVSVMIDGVDVPLKTDALLNIDLTNNNGDVPLLDSEVSNIVGSNSSLTGVLSVANFKFTGELHVDLLDQASSIIANLQLPPAAVTDSNGDPITQTVSATATNTAGATFNHIYFNLQNAVLGGVLHLPSAEFCYQQQPIAQDDFCSTATGNPEFGLDIQQGADDSGGASWNAEAKFQLAIGPSGQPITFNGQLGFIDGSFNYAEVALSGLNIQLWNPPPIDLTGVDAAFGLEPFRLKLGGTISVAKIVSVSGGLFVVWPGSGQTYTIKPSDLAPPGHTVSISPVTVDNPTVGVGGTLNLSLPLGPTNFSTQIADGYVLLELPFNYFAFGGEVTFDPLKSVGNQFVLDGQLDGQFAPSLGEYNISGDVNIQLALPSQSDDLLGFQGQAGAVVSDVGAGACGYLSGKIGPFSASKTIAIGEQWGSGVNVWFPDNCTDQLGPYTATVVGTASSTHGSRAAGKAWRVHLRAGLPFDMIKVIGDGAPPDVSVAGPDGVTASTAGSGAQVDARVIAVQMRGSNTTLISITHPRGGNYEITANADSPAIQTIFNAAGYHPTIQAHVVRNGSRERLVYSSNIPNAKLAFFETGEGIFHRLAVTAREVGDVTFTPAAGPGGTRSVVVTASANGYPLVLGSATTAAAGGTPLGGAISVASYAARAPHALGPIQQLRLGRSGGRLAITFAPVAGARLYGIRVRLSDGGDRWFVTPRPELTIDQVFGETTGSVTVEALGDGATSRDGVSTVAAFKPTDGL